MVGPSWNLNSGLSDLLWTWTLELAQPQNPAHFLVVSFDETLTSLGHLENGASGSTFEHMLRIQ